MRSGSSPSGRTKIRGTLRMPENLRSARTNLLGQGQHRLDGLRHRSRDLSRSHHDRAPPGRLRQVSGEAASRVSRCHSKWRMSA